MITLILGGQLGDEGKGSVVQWLAKKHKFNMVVRFGGANAGHSCIKDGEKFEMQSIPCSWVSQDIPIYFPETALIDKDILLKEIALVQKKGYNGHIWLSPAATLIEKSDLGWQKHSEKTGSMGSGVGLARAKRCLRMVRKAGSDADLRGLCRDDWIPRNLLGSSEKNILVEGSQGFGLSLNYGHYPWVSSTDITPYNILAECGMPFGIHEVRPILVIRTFPVRVPNPPSGTSGPMLNELSWDNVSEICGRKIEVQYDFRPPIYPKPVPKRIGEFDTELVRKAIWHSRPKEIFLTHIDWFFPDVKETGITDEVKAKVAEYEEKIEQHIDYVGIGTGEFLSMSGDGSQE